MTSMLNTSVESTHSTNRRPHFQSTSTATNSFQHANAARLGGMNVSTFVPEDTDHPHNVSNFEARMEEMEDRLTALVGVNTALANAVNRLESQQRRAEDADTALYKQLGNLVVTTSALSEKLKQLETTTFASLHEQLKLQQSEAKYFEEDIARVLENFRGELADLRLSLNERITQTNAQIAEVNDNQRESIHRFAAQQEEHLSRHKEKSSSMQFLTEEIRQDIQKQCQVMIDSSQRGQNDHVSDILKKLEQDIDKRHRRLVESTFTAINEASQGFESVAPQIRSLLNDALTLKEQARQNTLHIEQLRNDSSVESALTELKDWIQDIERKTMTRSEVDDALLHINSQLSSLKHSTQTSESLLTQKIEVEKSARESAVSHLSNQVIMSARKGPRP